MSLEALNEQLLRAVGAGIALFDAQTLDIKFRNETFESWFDEPEGPGQLTTYFGDIDLEAMNNALEADGRFVTEISFRRRRRTMVVAQSISKAVVDDRELLVVECQNVTRIRELEAMIESYSSMVERNTKELEREKAEVERLLLNIMPKAAYEEYKVFGVVTPQAMENVGVLVLRFDNFAKQLETLAPSAFVAELNELYSALDRIGEQFGCERIKTIGDRYMCVVGLDETDIDVGKTIAKAALRFERFIARRNTTSERGWQFRIGVGQGNAIGSVVGAQNYVYDIFGEAVDNALSALETAETNHIAAHGLTAESGTDFVLTSGTRDGFYAVSPAN